MAAARVAAAVTALVVAAVVVVVLVRQVARKSASRGESIPRPPPPVVPRGTPAEPTRSAALLLGQCCSHGRRCCLGVGAVS